MKYLSIDLETTGLNPDCLIIEFAAIPFDTAAEGKEGVALATSLTFHTLVHCPSFSELKPTLDQFVIDHNQQLIERAHTQGVPLALFKEDFQNYLLSPEIKNYFGAEEKIVLFGKSLNAIDLPFLTRDLGDAFMRTHFLHKVLDLTAFAFGLIDLNLLPAGTHSSSELMKYFKKGNVAHTALEDATNTAWMYLELLRQLKQKISGVNKG